ncbi:hypothetical protein F4859DRAFT_517673 [Xylaria cf. heliscus]|nr:hypothetical protein F4859DRAFT_517673 [Xylaria cf. heliscus]
MAVPADSLASFHSLDIKPGYFLGHGLVAARRIACGSLLLADPIFLATPSIIEDSRGWQEKVLNAYDKLDSVGKYHYLQLSHPVLDPSHETERLIRQRFGESRADAREFEAQRSLTYKIIWIYIANSFGLNFDGTESAVFLRASRFHHSCTPNVNRTYCPESRKMYFHAVRDIHESEEVCIAYRNCALPSADRAKVLPFVCGCALCNTPEIRKQSDQRRRRIAIAFGYLEAFYYSITGLGPPTTMPEDLLPSIILSARGLIRDLKWEQLFSLLSLAYEILAVLYIQAGEEGKARLAIRHSQEEDRMCNGQLARRKTLLWKIFKQKFKGGDALIPSTPGPGNSSTQS